MYGMRCTQAVTVSIQRRIDDPMHANPVDRGKWWVGKCRSDFRSRSYESLLPEVASRSSSSRRDALAELLQEWPSVKVALVDHLNEWHTLRKKIGQRTDARLFPSSFSFHASSTHISSAITRHRNYTSSTPFSSSGTPSWWNYMTEGRFAAIAGISSNRRLCQSELVEVERATVKQKHLFQLP